MQILLQRKDGTIRTPGAAETEITATAVLAKGDKLITELEDAMDSDKLLEIWEVNLEEAAEAGPINLRECISKDISQKLRSRLLQMRMWKYPYFWHQRIR